LTNTPRNAILIGLADSFIIGGYDEKVN